MGMVTAVGLGSAVESACSPAYGLTSQPYCAPLGVPRCLVPFSVFGVCVYVRREKELAAGYRSHLCTLDGINCILP